MLRGEGSQRLAGCRVQSVGDPRGDALKELLIFEKSFSMWLKFGELRGLRIPGDEGLDLFTSTER